MFASDERDNTLLVELEESLKLSQKRSLKAKHCVHELDHDQGILQGSTSKGNEDEKASTKDEEHLQKRNGSVTKHLNQLLDKDNKATSSQKEGIALTRRGTSLLNALERFSGQSAFNQGLLGELWTALALQKTGSQQRMAMYIKERERLAAESAILNVNFQEDLAEKNDESAHWQACFDGKAKRPDEGV